MYKKSLAILLLANLIMVMALFSVKGIQVNRIMSTEAFKLGLAVALSPEEETSFITIMEAVASNQRVVDYDVVEKKLAYNISEEDYEVLLRIVEAEAGGEDEDGKLLVANVVLNRVSNKSFPDTIKEVVFQKDNGVTQFSPVSSGRYYKVKISEETKAAVERALKGEDISEGALFFAARKYADSGKMKWFDDNRTFLFQHGGHEFFQ